MSKKIILYIGDYFCSNIKRRREIRMVANSNSHLEIVEKIIILYEKWNDVPLDTKDKEYSWISKNSKIEIVNWPTQQTYADFYRHSLNYPNNIIIIANSDIFFDHTLNRANELNFSPKKFYAVTRWERLLTQPDRHIWTHPFQANANMNWSYDCYIYSHPVDIIPESIDIKIGISGCDTYLVKKLIVDNLVKVEDPIYDIRTWHQDYRSEEGTGNDYTHKQSYSIEYDYPGSSKNFLGFGSSIGLKMQQIGCSPILKDRTYIRKGLKVISFSLWGNQEKYTKGAILNAELALDIYPGWRCWFYIHKDSVPNDIIEKLLEFPNVDIIFLETLTLAMSMRFRAIDHRSVDIMIVRDCDSQLSIREQVCVNEWLKSDKRLHILRDHPHHCGPKGHRIMGGMFGMKKAPYWTGWDAIFSEYSQYHGKWGLDQEILQQKVYPLFSKYCDIMVHAGFNKIESFVLDIPIKYDSTYNFIGSYLHFDGTRNEEHIQILKDALMRPPAIQPAQRLEVDTCLVSCRVDDECLDFFPVVHAVWNALCSVRCVLIIIGETIPDKLQKYSEDIILFPPEAGVDILFQTQIAPVLYASTFKNSKGVIISDLGLLPLRKMYIDIAKRFDNDRIIIYRDLTVVDKQFLIHYNVASPEVWKEIFRIRNFQDIKIRLRKFYSEGQCVNALLFTHILKWNREQGARLILLDDKYTNFHRLDKADIDFIQNNRDLIRKNITNQVYTDFHMPTNHESLITDLVSEITKIELS